MKQEIQLPLKEKSGEYACELPTLWFDREYLLDHVNGVAQIIGIFLIVGILDGQYKKHLSRG